MNETNMVQTAAKSTSRGLVRDQTDRLKSRIEPPADQLKEETADKVERIAEQVRELGEQLGRQSEAHTIARRLERTADYLRYRPSADVASDAWQAVTRSRTVWIAGGVIGALAAYGIYRAASNHRD
ncbi:MAG TPA: hypothetical protein VLB51_08770 [Methylomirabilota bacterium]|jgi:gamma-glutamyl:cysteine ligase YbdK (ATP-grasp superfamily)|nr:hypothetical protein [Methylomirabilota bacterium]